MAIRGPFIGRARLTEPPRHRRDTPVKSYRATIDLDSCHSPTLLRELRTLLTRRIIRKQDSHLETYNINIQSVLTMKYLPYNIRPFASRISVRISVHPFIRPRRYVLNRGQRTLAHYLVVRRLVAARRSRVL